MGIASLFDDGEEMTEVDGVLVMMIKLELMNVGDAWKLRHTLLGADNAVYEGYSND